MFESDMHACDMPVACDHACKLCLCVHFVVTGFAEVFKYLCIAFIHRVVDIQCCVCQFESLNRQ